MHAVMGQSALVGNYDLSWNTADCGGDKRVRSKLLHRIISKDPCRLYEGCSRPSDHRHPLSHYLFSASKDFR